MYVIWFNVSGLRMGERVQPRQVLAKCWSPDNAVLARDMAQASARE